MKRSRVLWAAVAFVSSTPALAGLHGDDLARCLIGSTSMADRESLVRWIFAALAQHPAVSTLTTIEPADADGSNKEIAGLVMRLLTDSCAQQTKDAIRYEGASAIEQSFNVLGQVAARDLMSHPDVGKMVAGLEQYLDKQKLEALGAAASE